MLVYHPPLRLAMRTFRILQYLNVVWPVSLSNCISIFKTDCRSWREGASIALTDRYKLYSLLVILTLFSSYLIHGAMWCFSFAENLDRDQKKNWFAQEQSKKVNPKKRSWNIFLSLSFIKIFKLLLFKIIFSYLLLILFRPWSRWCNSWSTRDTWS